MPNRNIHIRFFNTYEPVTTFYRDLLPMLARQDVQVEVYISKAEYRSNRGSLDAILQHPNIQIRYLPSMGILPNNHLQKVGLMMLYVFFASTGSLFSSKVDLNFFMTQPPMFALWGWILKMVRRQNYFCLVMDIYPDIAMQDGIIKKDGLIARILKALARFSWQQADGIIVIGRCQKEKLVAEGIPESKIHFIPNWVNNTFIHPVPPSQNHLRKELGLEKSFVVLYSGNMGVSHDFQTLLNAAERFLVNPNIAFVMVGDGLRRPELEREIFIRKLRNVILLPFQPLERLAESLSLGDIHIVTLRNGFEGLTVPSKAYGAQAVCRPLIYVGHSSGEIARMVQESKIGSVVSVGMTDELTKSILKYYQEPSLKRRHGQKAFQLHKHRYNSINSLKAYQTLLLQGRT